MNPNSIMFETYNSSNACSICLNEYEDGQKLAVISACNHKYHVACATAWLQNHDTCPLCRTHVCHRSPHTRDAFRHVVDAQFPSPLNTLAQDLPGYSPFSLQFDGTNALDAVDFDFGVGNQVEDNDFAELMHYFAS